MNREELAENEIKKLPRLAKSFMKRVQYTLEDIRKSRVQLFLTQKDQYRLLTLKSWEIKYKVDLGFILQTLIPFWEGFVQRHSKRMKREGLNVRVATLIGKKSEQILQDAINKQFPNSENVSLWMSFHKERITQHQLRKYGLEDKSKSDFNSIPKYMKYYKNRMKEECAIREQIIIQMRRRNFRNNPFREETCR